MTESPEDGNYLVRVRAQVMSRDDSSGGWVPLGGGGLSNVSVRKRPRPCPPVAAAGDVDGPDPAAAPKPKHDYLIYGKRISDNSIVLSCTIKKDFEYNKVMPTFHHWKTGDKKFGLTFQAAADARAFDKGVRTAVEDLLDGFANTSPTSPLPKCPKDVGDDDVFMTLDLPQDPKDSRSSSDSSAKGGDHLHRIAYKGRDKPPEPRQLPFEPLKGGRAGDNYPYVQLTAVHEYVYPPTGPDDRHHPHRQHHRHHLQHHHHRLQQQPLPLPTQQQQQLPKPPSPGAKKRDRSPPPPPAKPRPRCRHCNEPYSPAANARGSCEYAPDAARAAIEAVACLGCARCVCYHCARDADGEFAHRPCDCAGGGARRWCCLAALSAFVPCLWLYPPLMACHWCGARCGACGGRHEP